jgi:protein-disulfide isomerase
MCPIMVSRSRFLKLGLTALSVALFMSVAQAGDKPGKVDNSPVVASVNGREIHQSEVDAAIGNQVYELEKKLYTLRKQATDDAIARVLLTREAESRGKTVQELLALVADTASPPNADEVNKEFTENWEALRHLGEPAGRYRVFLDLQANQRTETIRRYIVELRSKATVRTLFEEPRRDLRLASTGAHLGNVEALVHLVVFLDYDCPFCKRLEPFFASMMKDPALQSRLDLVIKQMPLPIHSTARHAALAASCAADQNKFEPFHSRLLASSEHSDAAMVQLAKESGLNSQALSACMASPEAARQVDADLADARQLGVEGTPTVFLDGNRLEFSDPGDLLRQVSAKLEPQGGHGKPQVAGGGR